MNRHVSSLSPFFGTSLNDTIMNERWKKIKGYENLFWISSYGRVLDVKSKKIKTTHLSSQYYKIVSLKGKPFSVHRLVLMHFDRMPAPGEECNHIDFNPSNNRIDNLEWVTSSQNSIHSRENYRLSKQGEKNPAAKVTDLQAIEIKRLRKQKVMHRKIAEIFGITVQDSLNIATRYYSHIDHLV